MFDRLNEFNLNTDEQQKEESIPSKGFGVLRDTEWICIKEETDKLQIGQIKNIINQSILGEEYQAFEYQELNKGFDHLQINHSQSSI